MNASATEPLTERVLATDGISGVAANVTPAPNKILKNLRRLFI